MNNKEKMDAILAGFKSFIQGQDYFDVVYSEKVGYLRILVENPDEGAVELETPEMMMEYLCSDLISDIVYSPDNPKKSESDWVLTEYEEAESRRRLSAIFENMGIEKELSVRLVEKCIRSYQERSE